MENLLIETSPPGQDGTTQSFTHKKKTSTGSLGYVRNPRSLMEGTETLCRDDIGDLPGSPNHL